MTLTPERLAELRECAVAEHGVLPLRATEVVVLLDLLAGKDAEIKRLSARRWSAVGDALVPNDYMSPDEVGELVDPIRAEVADYRRTLTFGIECISCAKTLEKLYESEAEVEQLRAAVAAVEALADEWDAYDAEGYAAGDGPPALARVEEIRALLAEGVEGNTK